MKNILLLCFLTTQLFSQQVPLRPTNYVNDLSNVLNSYQLQDLNSISEQIEKESSSQVFTLIIDVGDNQDFNIEEYSLKVSTQWKIGQKGLDNGVLILVCPDVHQSRIEVGYGLEEYLTDAYTHQIQQQHFNPNFRQGDFYTGIKEVLTLIKNKISPTKEAGETLVNFLIWFLIISLALIGIGIYVYREYEKKKKLEEERLAKERQIKTENDRIQREAENEEAKFKKRVVESITSLKAMGDFKNANAILPKIEELFKGVKLLLADAMFKDYKDICQTGTEQINTLCQSQIEMFKIKNLIQNGYSKFSTNLDQLSHRYKNAIDNSRTILNAYDLDIWLKAEKDKVINLSKVDFSYPPGNSQVPKSQISDVVLLYQSAVENLNAEKYDIAKTNYDNAEKVLQEINFTIDSIFAKKTTIKTAIDNLNAYNTNRVDNVILTKVLDVIDYLKRHSSVISHSLKHEWNNFAAQTTHFKVNVYSRNPMLEVERIQNFLNDLDKFKKRAEKEVSDHEEERQRRMRSSSSIDIGGIGGGSSYSSFGGGGGGSFGGGGSSNS